MFIYNNQTLSTNIPAYGIKQNQTVDNNFKKLFISDFYNLRTPIIHIIHETNWTNKFSFI